MARSIQHINWAALGANLASTLLFTLLLLSPFLWGAPVWHWLLAVAISLVLGIYFYVRRERFEEPGPDADETHDSPADRTRKASVESRAAALPVAADLERGFSGHLRGA